MSKADQLKDLYNTYRRKYSDKEVVVGDGNVDTAILLIGEAPGKDEVRISKPFVGMAGKNLSEFLDVLDLKREDIYITNAIKFRLSALNPKTGRLTNRPAAKEEIVENREYLIEEIKIICPKYIVTLGNVPLKSVTNDYNASIGSVHGQLKPLSVEGIKTDLYPLYHPASIIYNRSLKEVYQTDLEYLKQIISQ